MLENSLHMLYQKSFHGWVILICWYWTWLIIPHAFTDIWLPFLPSFLLTSPRYSIRQTARSFPDTTALTRSVKISCCTLLLSLCFHTGRTVRGREEVWCREVERRWQRQCVCMRSLCPHVLHITLVYAVSFHWSWESFQNNENLIIFLLLAKTQISLIVQGFDKGKSCFSFYLASVRDWTQSLRAGVAEVNVEHR